MLARIGKLISAAAAVVLILTGVFGHVLEKIAPPVANVDIKVGVASLGLLALLLIVALLGKRYSGRKYGAITLCFSAFFLVLAIGLYVWYDRLDGEYVYLHPTGPSNEVSKRYIRGELHDKAPGLMAGMTVAGAVMYWGGRDYVTTNQMLWYESSQRQIEHKMTVLYLALVACFGACVFLAAVRLLDAKAK